MRARRHAAAQPWRRRRRRPAAARRPFPDPPEPADASAAAAARAAAARDKNSRLGDSTTTFLADTAPRKETSVRTVRGCDPPNTRRAIRLARRGPPALSCAPVLVGDRVNLLHPERFSLLSPRTVAAGVNLRDNALALKRCSSVRTTVVGCNDGCVMFFAKELQISRIYIFFGSALPSRRSPAILPCILSKDVVMYQYKSPKFWILLPGELPCRRRRGRPSDLEWGSPRADRHPKKVNNFWPDGRRRRRRPKLPEAPRRRARAGPYYPNDSQLQVYDAPSRRVLWAAFAGAGTS